jgi:hypothetical protein
MQMDVDLDYLNFRGADFIKEMSWMSFVVYLPKG